MRHYQRALSMINRNIVGAYPYPGEVNKRPALSENNAPSNKNHMPIPPISANRPITRKFAAKMAGKQKQPLPEETKKVVQSLPILTESRDCSIIDVDDYKIVGDSPALMFVQHTEAMLEEIYRMDQFDLQGNPSDVASFLIRDSIWTCLVIWRAEASSFCVFVHITLHVFWLRCKFYIFVGIIGHVW
ncbi:hypothetical protein HYC85_032097 [Camellia sinensis]|uniref:Uncharacterized protein n=1 Tax=Camellia sinensis TaxID=4442 RepID=A0A7J7FWD4_CAMSI|nr:hypothetical protein HYC85_032097 [Camellia sinensis]